MQLVSLLVIGMIAAILAVGLLKRFELTPVLVLGNLAIFFVGLFADQTAIVTNLAFQPVYLQNGQNLYTIFTSMFVHDGFLHVLGNVLFLFFLGSPLEARIGKARFAVVYFAAGIGGAILASVVLWDTPLVYMLGASGAISGIVGALLILYPRDEIPMLLGPIFLPRVPVWLSALSWLVFDVIIVILTPLSGVSWEAHLGGFMTGLVVGLVIGRKVEQQRIREQKPIDFSALEPLATTPQLRNALDMLRNETHKDIRKAWLEYFAENAKCPKCNGKMKLKGNKLTCPCGFEVEVS